jgi:hypothetical protein
MTSAEVPFISVGVKSLLLRLRCGSERQNHFPNKALGSWYAPKRQPPAALLLSLLESFESEDALRRDALTERILVLASVTWADPGVLRAFSLQGFVVEEFTLLDVYRQKSADTARVHYYRCDHHPTMLGELFSHPTPHIHTYGDDSPRFAFPWTGNPIASFLEFLYLNHDYNTWCEWAYEVCLDKHKDEVFDELARLSKLGDLAQLMKKPHVDHLADLRRLLQSKRRGEMRCELEGDAGDALSYEREA